MKLNGTTRVDVYKNLRLDTFSIRDMTPGSANYSKVIAHQDYALLINASFHVGEKGRQRVLKTGQKNVHAFVRGYYVYPPWDSENLDVDKMAQVTYNPYQHESFVWKDSGEKVQIASEVVLKDGKVYARRHKLGV